MFPRVFIRLWIFLLAGISPLPARFTTVLSESAYGWAYLHPTTGVDPATSDGDFHTTWFDQALGAYPGAGAYDGPAFTTGATAPFVYGEVDGITSGTTLATPASDHRYTSYFLKIIDGGANGYHSLEIDLLADDGAFVYLNGTLIARDNIADPDTFTGLTPGGGEESTYDRLVLLGAPVLNPGANLLAISNHQKENDSSDFGFAIRVRGIDASRPAPVTLFAENASGWAYLHPTTGVDPATGDGDFHTTWFDQALDAYPGAGAYDGPAFTTGATAPFVYGEVDGITPGTTLATPASDHRYTSYFLKSIDGGANGYHSLEIDLLADDGAFLYLNGTLIARDNIADPDTFTRLTPGGGEESSYDHLVLVGTPVLNPGANLLAISNHQKEDDSSDFGFGIRLRGIDASTPAPVTLVAENASGWAYLHSLDGSNNGVDPDLSDPDFDFTWFDQSFGSYPGTTGYDGPAFTTGATAPFVYGEISGITPGTTLTTPVSGTRQTAYFLYEFDGGATGYSGLNLSLHADDGAFVYLNGNRIAATNLGAATPDTWELDTEGSGSEDVYSSVRFIGTTQPLVKPGPNLLAVSTHQNNDTSSDLGLKLQLTGVAGLPDIGAVYPRNLTHYSTNLTWCTSQAGDSTVNYGLAPGSLTLSATLPGSRTDHRVPLSGLAPGTTYFFEVVTTDGDSFTADETGSFTTLEDPVIRGPYLQSASHDRITVCWRTSYPGSSTVQFGTSQDSLTQSVTVPGWRTDHEVTLDPATTPPGLAANTTYFYQVKTDNGTGGVGMPAPSADHFFTTAPPAGTPASTRIWVIGDSGTANSNAAAVYNAFRNYNGRDHTDVWLMLGDNAYDNGSDSEYQKAVFDMYPELLRNTHLWSTFGNHDSSTDDGAPYFAAFHFPTAGECGGVASGTERYYSFDYGNIHFVCLDSQTPGNYDDTLGGGGMADWLQADLEASTADWIIAYFHHGPYTKGSHNSDTELQHVVIRSNLLSILEDYGVDLVLAGHSHCYERSGLLNGHYGLSTSYDPASHALDPGNGSEVGSIDASGNFVLTGADGAYQKPLAAGNMGQVSSIVGCSGELSDWDNGSSSLVNPAPHPVMVANLRVRGSMVIDIDGSSLHAVFLDRHGSIRDDFTILKGSTLAAAAEDATMAEDSGDRTATVTVTRTGATDLPLTVDYSLGGTANAADYAPDLLGTLSFASGEIARQLVLTIASDDHAEGPETLTLTLLPRTNTITGTSAPRDTSLLATPGQAEVHLADQLAEAWWFSHFGPDSLNPASWLLDHDRDGFAALAEYGLNGDPNAASLSIGPQATLNPTGLELHYVRDNSKTDIQYRVLTSTDLVHWTQEGVTDTIDGAPNPTGPESRKATIPLTSPGRFLLLDISFP